MGGHEPLSGIYLLYFPKRPVFQGYELMECAAFMGADDAGRHYARGTD